MALLLLIVVILCWIVTLPLWLMESLTFARNNGTEGGWDFLVVIVPAMVSSSLIMTSVWFYFRDRERALAPQRWVLVTLAAIYAAAGLPACLPTVQFKFGYIGSLGLAAFATFIYALVGDPRGILRSAIVAATLAYVLPVIAVGFGYEQSEALPMLATTFTGAAIAVGIVFFFTRGRRSTPEDLHHESRAQGNPEVVVEGNR